MKSLLAACLVLVSLGAVSAWSAPVEAALPPSELMEARLEQARRARAPVEATVTVTVTGRGVVEYRGDVRVVTRTKITLKSGEKELELSPQSEGLAKGLGGVLAWLLLSDEFVSGVSARGEFEPKKNGIEVIGDAFGYRYGVMPAIVVSRSLDRVLEVRWQDDGTPFVARFEYGEGDWPRVISVTRAGAPWARLEMTPRS